VQPLPASVLGGQDLAVSRHTKQPKAAEALIQFLTSKDSQIQLYLDGGLAPTRATAYEAAFDATRGRDENFKTFTRTLRSAVEDARQRPISTHYQLFSSVFQGLVDKAIDGDGSLPAQARKDLSNALRGRLE